MELTTEKARAMASMMLMEAKRQRENIPYSKTDGFAQVVVFLGPNLEPTTSPIMWKTEGEKYQKFAVISKIANDLHCQAVVTIMDTRWVEEANAVKILGIPPHEESGLEAFQTNYKRAVQEKFGGYLGNAPKELFSEAVMVVMKGPRLKGIVSVMAPYAEGPKDSIQWLPPRPDHRAMHFNLLPDWWC